MDVSSNSEGETLNRNRSIVASVIICSMMVLIAAVPTIISDTNAASNEGDYYFSGSLMDILSDSKGISDKNYKVSWSLEGSLGYAIVNDHVYVATKDGNLNKVDMSSGEIVKSVKTDVINGDCPTVGGGLVLDPRSGNVYDLDLNQKYKIDASSELAYYDDGYWYVVQANKECRAFTIEDEDPTSDANVQSAKWTSKFCFYIDGFTLPVSVAFSDKALFYPGIGEEDMTKRIVYSVDKRTGVQLDSYEMTEIPSTFWNSGFIHQVDGTVMISTHWDNMFGPLGDGSKPVFVSIDTNKDGTFVKDSVKYIRNGTDNSYSSCLVKIGDLGFAQTGSSFKVFDLSDDNKVIASTDFDKRLSKTYSNIAIATGTDDYVYGYVSPAGIPESFTSPSDGLICFEYRISTNEIRAFDLNVGEEVAGSASNVKIGPNGEVIFMKSDSKIYCISKGSTDDGNSALIIAAILAVAMIAFMAVMRRR